VSHVLSTRGRYGLQALFRLAQRGEERPVPLKEIAEAEGLPEAYLEQLMAPLRKAGIVRSVRGPQGGYALARAAGDIDIWQVLLALEGELAFGQCTCPPDPDHEASCLDALLWRDVDRELKERLQRETLAGLVERAKARREQVRPLYYI
jgi:Rrf2 family cysteine metabolism transcriptional repressor